MQNRILEIFELLPKAQQEAIHTLHRSQSLAEDLEVYIAAQIPNWLHSSTNEKLPDHIKTWFQNEENFLFLPFVWDQLTAVKKRILADQIAGLIRAGHSTIKLYLTCADLKDSDFSELNLEGAILRKAWLTSTDLRNTNLSYADLRGAVLRSARVNYDKDRQQGTTFIMADLSDADVTLIRDLTPNHLSQAIHLFQTKFGFSKGRFTSNDLEILEIDVLTSYQNQLAVQYCEDQNEEVYRVSVINPILQLIQLSDFSCQEWGVRKERFDRMFHAMHDHQADVIANIKKKIKETIPGQQTGITDYTDAYYKFRAQLTGFKIPLINTFWKPEPCAARANQIETLRSILNDNDLSVIVPKLAQLKKAIKQEFNLFDSFLLDRISTIITQAVDPNHYGNQEQIKLEV